MDLPTAIVACGTALATLVGAVMMRRAPSHQAEASAGVDPPARLQERVAALEARVSNIEAEQPRRVRR